MKPFIHPDDVAYTSASVRAERCETCAQFNACPVRVAASPFGWCELHTEAAGVVDTGEHRPQ
jgi:hypothetical protein